MTDYLREILKKLEDVLKELPFTYDDDNLWVHANKFRNLYMRYIRKAISEVIKKYKIKDPQKRFKIMYYGYMACVDVFYYGEDAYNYWSPKINQLFEE